jgi:hypothetical protein
VRFHIIEYVDGTLTSGAGVATAGDGMLEKKTKNDTDKVRATVNTAATGLKERLKFERKRLSGSGFKFLKRLNLLWAVILFTAIFYMQVSAWEPIVASSKHCGYGNDD